MSLLNINNYDWASQLKNHVKNNNNLFAGGTE